MDPVAFWAKVFLAIVFIIGGLWWTLSVTVASYGSIPRWDLASLYAIAGGVVVVFVGGLLLAF